MRLLLVLALAGCPKPAPAPSPPSTPADAAVAEPAAAPLDQDLPALALRAVELYEAVAKIFAAAGTNCAAATEQMRALRPTYAEVTAASARVLHAGRAKEMRTALDPYMDRLDVAGTAIGTSATMQACSGDAGFTKAFDELIGAPP